MTLKQHLRTSLATGLLAASALTSLAQPSGQWDFNSSNLTASAGAALTYIGGPTGDTGTNTFFGTTTSFGLPLIGGADAVVMKFPAGTNASLGFIMPVPNSVSGNGALINDWTIVMDVLYTGASHAKARALVDTDGAFINADAEFFVNSDNGIGPKNSSVGVVASNTWHRVGFVVNATANTIRKYIDGVEVGSNPAGGIDGRYAITPPDNFAPAPVRLFSDDNGEAYLGYVNSIQFRTNALTPGQMLALGTPSAAGIPQVIPQVPSAVTKWTPSRAYAPANTPIIALINAGDATITPGSIAMTLNGLPVTPVIEVNPTNAALTTVAFTNSTPLALASENLIVVSYSDSQVGAKAYTNKFSIALLYEDFDSLVLGSNLVEGVTTGSGGQRSNVWTSVAPAGWAVTNPPPGFSETNGVLEWKGWGFADRAWWVQTAGDQNRGLFLKAEGTVAISDPDEWDDVGGPVSFGQLFNSVLVSKSFPLTNVNAGTTFLRFDSSWRPEAQDDGPFPTNNQTAIITVSYNGGAEIQVLKWDSISTSPTFKADAENETVQVALNNPAGVTNAVLTFKLLLGANDWWWAVDNIVVFANNTPVITAQPASQTIDAGKPVTFSVSSTVNLPHTFQWRFHGTNIVDATNATYTIATVETNNAGPYSVLVSNSSGTTTSSNATLTVISTPLVVTQPVQQIVVSPGWPASAFGTARGRSPISYLWLKDGVSTGITTSNLVITGATAGSAGAYQLVFSNTDGSTTSTVAQVVVPTTITQDLVAHLKFDGDYADASGRGNNATAVGTPAIVVGKIGSGAMQFTSAQNGSSFNYATLGSPADLDFGASTDFTISYWVKVNPNSFRADPPIIGNKNWGSGGNQGFVLVINGGTLRWNFKESGGTRYDFNPGGSRVDDGSWRHFLVAFDRGVGARTYVDGVLRGTTSIGAGFATIGTPSGLAFNIGQDGTGTYTDGNAVGITNAVVDDVGIWRRALSEQEARAIYAAGLEGTTLSAVTVPNPMTSPVTVPGTITRMPAATNSVYIWTGMDPGLVLQRSDSLTNWVDVPGSAGGRAMLIPPTNSMNFFRLFKVVPTNP